MSNKKLTTEEFIKKAREVHGDKYDYSKVNYIDNKTKITIHCNKCNRDFDQRPNDHLNGHGCSYCGGTRKLTTEEFIRKAKEIHGDKYNYDKVVYVNNNTKVIIHCNECNKDFEQTPGGHLAGYGCPTCAGNVNLTTEEFIRKAKEIHGDKYNYDKVVYVNNKTKVIIHCNECDKDFEQTPHRHLQGDGCPHCCRNKKLTREEFIRKAKEIHGDKYNYDKVVYVNNRTKVIIHCNECNKDFEQTPNSHLCGEGCPWCAGIILNTEEFIRKAKEIHGDKYNYDKVVYVNSKTKVIIHCNECNRDFEQLPHSHLIGQGCPACNFSKGERLLREAFSDSGIDFEEQHSWDWLVYISKQHVDFYLPYQNIVVEFQGEQHFVDRKFFGGKEGLKTIVLRDQNKKKLCEEHGIKVIYFSNMTKVLGEDFKYPYDVIEDIDELIRIIKNLPDL